MGVGVDAEAVETYRMECLIRRGCEYWKRIRARRGTAAAAMGRQVHLSNASGRAIFVSGMAAKAR